MNIEEAMANMKTVEEENMREIVSESKKNLRREDDQI